MYTCMYMVTCVAAYRPGYGFWGNLNHVSMAFSITSSFWLASF